MSELWPQLREEHGAAGTRFVLGVVLIAIGITLIATRLFHGLAEGSVVLVIGAVLLAVWAMSDRYGHLVLGSILVSVGLGGIIAGDVGNGHAGSIALGGGFLAIYVLDRLRHRTAHWWPLLPGVALVLGGALAETSVLRQYFWPVALVIVGLLIVSGEWRGRTARGWSRREGPGRRGDPFGGPGGASATGAGAPEVVEGKVVAEDEPTSTPTAAANE
jgi:hypothetical protein